MCISAHLSVELNIKLYVYVGRVSLESQEGQFLVKEYLNQTAGVCMRLGDFQVLISQRFLTEQVGHSYKDLKKTAP